MLYLGCCCLLFLYFLYTTCSQSVIKYYKLESFGGFFSWVSFIYILWCIWWRHENLIFLLNFYTEYHRLCVVPIKYIRLHNKIPKSKWWIATKHNRQQNHTTSHQHGFLFLKHCNKWCCYFHIFGVHFSWYRRFRWTAIHQSERVPST